MKLNYYSAVAYYPELAKEEIPKARICLRLTDGRLEAELPEATGVYSGVHNHWAIFVIFRKKNRKVILITRIRAFAEPFERTNSC